jgi:predicted nicotinamide N-methyase
LNGQVLDVGTGRGLLLIAAAKKLSGSGRAVGIDIWKASDLSENLRGLGDEHNKGAPCLAETWDRMQPLATNRYCGQWNIIFVAIWQDDKPDQRLQL